MSYGGPNDDFVAVRTTATAAPVTVPAGTSITDLRFTPITGPNGDKNVALYPAGDQFLAVEGDQGFRRSWIGDANGRWRQVAMPQILQGALIENVTRVHNRIVVIGSVSRRRVVLEGQSFDDLRESPWSASTLLLPATISPAPPSGHGIEVSGYPDATAVGEHGIVMIGRASANLNLELLPSSIRDAYVQAPGRVDVRDGRVILTGGSDFDRPLFDEPARALGLTAAEIEYLSRPDEARSRIVSWGADWGQPIRQFPTAGIDDFRRYGNFALTRVADGFVLTAPDTATAYAIWWSRDGRAWQALTAPPGEIMSLVEVGSRWIIPSASVVSDDQGRSWIPNDIAGNIARHAGASPLLGAGGTSEFGLLGSSNPLDASTVTVFAGRLLYSPDGMHWSSVTLEQALGFDANIPTIAVGNRSAIVEAGLRAPGVVAQRFWLVTLRT